MTFAMKYSIAVINPCNYVVFLGRTLLLEPIKKGLSQIQENQNSPKYSIVLPDGKHPISLLMLAVASVGQGERSRSPWQGAAKSSLALKSSGTLLRQPLNRPPMGRPF